MLRTTAGFTKVWQDIVTSATVYHQLWFGARLFLKIFFDNFNDHVSNSHSHWSDEFQIPNLRKAVTLCATTADRNS